MKKEVKLYRLVWTKAGTDKKCSTWWEMSKDRLLADKDKIEKEYNCVCELEEKKV